MDETKWHASYEPNLTPGDRITPATNYQLPRDGNSHMQRFLFASALLFAATTPAFAQTPQATTGPPAPREINEASLKLLYAHDVRLRVLVFRDALRNADEAALNSIYADDYSITNDAGEAQTKAERLAWVKANGARLSGLEFRDLIVRVYGDAAVVTGRATSTADGLNSRMTQVWVRQGGVWRLAAAQTTAISQAQPQATEKKP